MRVLFIAILLLAGMLVPAFAADTADATATTIKKLQNADQVMNETIANVQLDVETMRNNTQKSLDALSSRLDAEIAARGASDKLIAELQNELANEKLKTAALQAQLDTMKADQAKAIATLNDTLTKNTSQDKKDRTITYVLSAVLGALALSK